jgi:hypothetical protein
MPLSTITQLEPFNINSSATFSFANTSVTANVSAGNIKTDNLLYANGTAWTFGSTYSNTNVAAYLPTYSGNVSANYFSGNGSLLTSVTGANVTGYVATATAANTAGTVTTAAQPNITSVGTLTDVTVSGDATITGNLTVSGTYTYANVTSFIVKDPIIEQGGNPNGTPLSSNDGKDRGQLLHYYSSSAIDAFMGWDNSNSEFGFGSNVSVSSEVVTWNSYGNIRAGYIIGNGSTLTDITGANVTGYVATASAANTAATVTTNAQPNITSVGTLTSLTSGLITATSGGIKVGNLQDPSGTNTIQLLNSNISVTGNIVAGSGGSGNVTATYFIGNGSQLTGLPASYSNTNVAAYLPTYTGNVSAGNVLTDNLLYANGTAWSFSNYSNTNVAAYLPTYTGNLSPGNLSVTTSANLGNVSNLVITGGTSGYVLRTDGSGGLSWVAQSGGGGGIGVAVGTVQEFTANGTGNTYTLSITPTNEDQLTVNIDGVLQLHSSYTLSGNVVTLDGTPVNGAKVEITNFNSGGAAGSNTQVQFNDSGNIAGSAALTFDTSSNTFNATNITSNGAPVATTGKAIAMAIVFGF